MKLQFQIRPPENLTQGNVSRILAQIFNEFFPADRFDLAEADSAWEDKIRVTARNPQLTLSAYRYEFGDPIELTIDLSPSAEASLLPACPALRDRIVAELGGELIPPP